MLLVAIRALVLYAVLVTVTRVMGKRQVGELQPFEFVVAILLAELAATPLSNKETPLLNGLVAIFTLLIAHVFVSYLALESQSVRQVVCGRPSVLIDKGKIQEQELRALRYNINDLLEQLRGAGYANIGDVEFAILETNGKLSVIPKSQHRPVTPADMSLPTNYEDLPRTLIVDGTIIKPSLSALQLDEAWLCSELAKFNIHNVQDVLFAGLDAKGKLNYQVKAAKSGRPSECAH